MKDYRVEMQSVGRLRRLLDNAIFAIPSLQREFVWNGNKAAALLDSIYRGMPIGTILIWDTEGKNQHLLRKTLHILPDYHSTNSRIWFLIDGQQRLSVLYQAGEGQTCKNSDGREIDFSRLTFNLMNGEGDNEAPVFRYRRPIEAQHVSVKDVLSPKWKYWFRGLPKYKLSQIEKCRNRLLKFKVPIQFIETKDIDEVRELFIRINSLGTPIGSADRAFARASEFDIRSRANEIRATLPKEFQSLPYEVILQAFALVAGKEEFRDIGQRAYDAAIRHWENRVRKDESQKKVFYSLWGRLKTAIEKSIDFLHQNFCVWTAELLPSENMVSTLSVFFFNSKGTQAWQKQELRKWFWATGVGQRYSGRGHRQNILADAVFMKKLASGRSRFSFSDRVDPAEVRRTEYNRRSSIADSFSCLLLKRGPRYLSSGDAVPLSEYSSYANRKHRHHIFPRALLARNGFGHKQYNSICNICLIVAEENHEIGAKRPDNYLGEHCRKNYFHKFMKSHLIPHGQNSPIWNNRLKKAYAAFMRERHKLICRAFEEEAGIKLFKKE